jgi:hypothetical protein
VAQGWQQPGAFHTASRRGAVKAVAWTKCSKLSKPFMHNCRALEETLQIYLTKKPPILEGRLVTISSIRSCSRVQPITIQSDLPQLHHIFLLSQRPRSDSNDSTLTTRKETRHIYDFLPLLTDPCNPPTGVERDRLGSLECWEPAAASSIEHQGERHIEDQHRKHPRRAQFPHPHPLRIAAGCGLNRTSSRERVLEAARMGSWMAI